jgi:hypothetical protein
METYLISSTTDIIFFNFILSRLKTNANTMKTDETE